MSADKTLGTVKNWRQTMPGLIELNLTNGKAVISGISESIIRVRIAQNKKFQDDVSYSIEKPLPSVSIKAVEIKSKQCITINAGQILLSVNTKEFAVSVLDSSGKLLSEGAPIVRSKQSTIDKRVFRTGDDVFGLGERVTPLGRRGYNSIEWNVDNNLHHAENTEPMYSSFPFAIIAGAGLMPWGYFLDSPYLSRFDTGSTDWNSMSVKLDNGEYNVYFIAGPTVREIVQAYTDLTGTHAMPPIWALGYHQCRWSYMSTDHASEIAENLRSRKIPCDVLWYDIDYMDNFKVFTFDKKRFGNVRKHFADMADMGFRKVVIVDPGVKIEKKGVYDIVDEGTSCGYFIKNPDGTDYIGKVWPGGTKFPDFSHPDVAAWWGDLHERYYDAGVDAFWNDMNEPADMSNKSIIDTTGTVPNNVLMYDNGRNSTMERMHNTYATFEAKATIGGMQRLRPDDRPFLLTRAGFAGIQKYSAKWYGDNHSTWAHLKASISQTINMGLSGLGFAGSDVGGFGHNSTPELLARWTQLGAFYPFFRNHSSSGTLNQEPWRFGKETEDICRSAIELRYHFIPYFYQLFFEMHKHGIPIMRPLFWHYPDDKKAYTVIDEFQIGQSLLVAPVVERGATERLVYLPKGEWHDYATGEKYSGGHSYVVNAPIDKCPIFIKAGSIIPVMKPVDSTADIDKLHLMLEIACGGAALEHFYEDDMLTTAYCKGVSCRHTLDLGKKELRIVFDPSTTFTKVTIRIMASTTGGKAPTGFSKKGIWMERQFKREGKELSVALK